MSLALLALGAGLASPVSEDANARAMVSVGRMLGSMVNLLQRNAPSGSVQQQSSGQPLQSPDAARQQLGAAPQPSPSAALPQPSQILAGVRAATASPLSSLPPPEDDGIIWTPLSSPTPVHPAATAGATAKAKADDKANASANATAAATANTTGMDSGIEQILLVMLFLMTLYFLVDCCGPELSRHCFRKRAAAKVDR